MRSSFYSLRLCVALVFVLMSLEPSACSGQKTKKDPKRPAIRKPALNRAQERATHTQDQIRSVREIHMRVLPVTHWTTKYHNGAAWETTSSHSDLDNDVRLGAKILKYPDGRYVQTIHRQYPSSCGPSTLAMVLKQLGVTGRSAQTQTAAGNERLMLAKKRPLLVKRDVDIEGTDTVSVGYGGSTEHLMWLGFHRKRLNSKAWNGGNTSFMQSDGRLNSADSTFDRSFLAIGNDMNYLSFEKIPAWMWNAPGVGCGGDNNFHGGLPGIMNYIYSGGKNGPWRDARPLYLDGRTDEEVIAARRIIKGFIDHNMSIVGAVESGGHFNAVIGYRGSVSPAEANFWVYTADPLNGWGRSDATRQPGTWRRIRVNRTNLNADKRVFMAIIPWNHHAEGNAQVGFRPGDWARQVDKLNNNKWLTGSSHQPAARDPLKDSMTKTARRMPPK